MAIIAEVLKEELKRLKRMEELYVNRTKTCSKYRLIFLEQDIEEIRKDIEFINKALEVNKVNEIGI